MKWKNSLKPAIFKIILYTVFLIQIYYLVTTYKKEEELFVEIVTSKIVDIIFKNPILGFTLLIIAMLSMAIPSILYCKIKKEKMEKRPMKEILLFFILMTQFFIIVRSLILLDIFPLLVSILVVLSILFSSKIENFLKTL